MQTLGMVFIFFFYSLVLFQNIFNMYHLLIQPTLSLQPVYSIRGGTEFSYSELFQINTNRLNRNHHKGKMLTMCRAITSEDRSRFLQMSHTSKFVPLSYQSSSVISTQTISRVLLCPHFCRSLQLYNVFTNRVSVKMSWDLILTLTQSWQRDF